MPAGWGPISTPQPRVRRVGGAPYRPRECAEALADYALTKKRRGVIDFDDVLDMVGQTLARDSEYAEAMRWRFRHLLVDEAQDLNPLQHRLIDLLRAGRDDLFLVGDPSQAVYGFNGADAAMLREVETHFSGIEVIRLPTNHRCTPQIVEAGLHVLKHDEPASLISGRPDGVTVMLSSCTDEDDEAAHIAISAKRLDPTLVRTSSVAVLARTRRQLDAVARALSEHHVPVRQTVTGATSPLHPPLSAAGRLDSAGRLRAWAHDILDNPEQSALGHDHPDNLVAHAVLEFLRENPIGDGADFRSWVSTARPFDDHERPGVELLTFHAAKGREWNTVFVSGVETSLVPHRSASTSSNRAEEARLLYVALTRATDRLVVTWAPTARRLRAKAQPFPRWLHQHHAAARTSAGGDGAHA